MDDFSLVLGMDFIDSVKPWTFEKNETMTIAKGYEACSVPITQEVVEVKLISAMQVNKGFQRRQATRISSDARRGGDQQGDILEEVSETLKEFEDVMPLELQKNLPPR